jgi:uncharacterized protein
MALFEKYLFIKKSTIPNAGKGLFTKKFIPKGSHIVEYKGKISAWRDVKHEDGKNAYIFYVNRNHVINGEKSMKALARYANDAKGLVKIKGLVNNAEYAVVGLRAYIESKKDIPAGSEIFVDYGDEYWKVIRENKRLWAKEAKEAEKEKTKKVKKVKKAKKKAKARKPANKKVNKVAKRMHR